MKASVIVRMIDPDTIARRIKASEVQRMMKNKGLLEDQDKKLQKARRLIAQLERG